MASDLLMLLAGCKHHVSYDGVIIFTDAQQFDIRAFRLLLYGLFVCGFSLFLIWLPIFLFFNIIVILSLLFRTAGLFPFIFT